LLLQLVKRNGERPRDMAVIACNGQSNLGREFFDGALALSQDFEQFQPAATRQRLGGSSELLERARL
jgi:hypothetical protein